MDHKTRVWNALHFRPVDRVPFDLSDEAGYLFEKDRYDPKQRLFLSLRQKIAARIRFHQEFDTDLIFDTPVLAQGSVPCHVQLTPTYAERYDLRFAVFPYVGGLWQPWPPHIELKSGTDVKDDDRIELNFEWGNGLSHTLTVEMAGGSFTGYDVLVRSREEWPLWQEVFTPRLDAFDFSYVNQILTATGGDIALYGTILGPYSMFVGLFGLEQGSLLLYDDPEFAGQVMDWLTEVAIEVGSHLARHGINVLRVGEGSAGLLGPRLYRQFGQPRHKRMNAALRAAGAIPTMHESGTCNQLLEGIADGGWSGLQSLFPPPLGDIDLGDAKRRIGKRLCLKGGLDALHVVCRMPAAQVASETRRCLAIGAPGSGYILSVADCLILGTPLENLYAISEVVHSFVPPGSPLQ